MATPNNRVTKTTGDRASTATLPPAETIELELGPVVAVDAIDLVLDLERRGYDLVFVNGQPVVRPGTGLTWRDTERLRQHRADIIEIVDYCASPAMRPWGANG